MNDQLNKRSLFDVAIRVLGLYQLTVALSDLGAYINMLQKLYDPLRESPGSQLTFAAIRTIAGLFLLFGASTIVCRFYGEDRPGDSKEQMPD